MPRSVASDRNEDNIKVVVRARPMNAVEKRLRQPCLVSCDEENRTVAISQVVGNKKSAKTYTFDTVFSPYASQEDVYSKSVRPIVQDVLLGFNCTVFAYGQTGTGKTYTMEGDLKNEVRKGMIPRAVESLFEQLPKQNQSEFSAKVSFLELYNEELFDLLTDLTAQTTSSRSSVRLVDDKSKQVVCQNLTEVLVNDLEDVLKVMEKALSRRQTAETKLNKSSSRSHCIFTLTVHIRERTVEGEDLVKVGKLNLVDLAGSESVGRAGGNDKRVREAGNINKSLLTLGRVITALVEKTPHIPYRDSKLTRLLQESLGGRAKTLVIATVGPSLHSLEETISTLDYASRAKSIKNKPRANKKLTKHELIKEYVEDMERMRKELEAARSKDGVWLSQEQYESMRLQVETQEKQMANMEKGLSGREQELEQKNHEIHRLTEELQLARNKIAYLEKVKEDLEKTVADQAYEIEERDFIIQEFQTTEDKHLLQVGGMRKALEESVSDISLLHAKVRVQSELEQANFTSIHEFRDETKGNLSSFCAAAMAHQKECFQRVGDLQTEISNYHSSEEAYNEAVQQTILEMLDDSHKQQKEVLTQCVKHFSDLKDSQLVVLPSLSEQFLKSALPRIEEFSKKAQNFTERLEEVIEQKFSQRVNGLKTKVEGNLKSLKENLDGQGESLKLLTNGLLQVIMDITNREKTRVVDEKRRIKEYKVSEQDRWQKAELELEEKFKLMMKTLKDNSLSTLEIALGSSENFATSVEGSLVKITESCQEFTSEQSELLESEKIKWCGEAEKIETEVRMTSDEIKTASKEVLADQVSEKENVFESVANVSEEIRAFNKELGGRLTKVVVGIDAEVEELRKGSERNIEHSKKHCDNIENLQVNRSLQRKKDTRMLENTARLLSKSSEIFSSQAVNTATTVTGDVDSLTQKKLRKYQGGTPPTPKKRSYQYDKASYATEPIALLKEKLKLSFLESNAIEEEVPPAEINNSSLQEIFEESESECIDKENVEPNYDGLKVKDLRKLLAKKGLSQVGRKEELKRRLLENHQTNVCS